MKDSEFTLWAIPTSGLTLFKHQKKLLLLIVLLSVISILPLIIKNIVVGYHFLAFCLSVFLLSLLVDTYFILRKLPAPIHYCIVTTTLLLSIVLTEIQLGLSGLFWIFPVTTALIFILPTKASYWFNSCFTIISAIIAFNQFEPIVAARFTLSLLFTLLIVTVALKTIRTLVNQLKDQSIKDPLTGAFNRRQLQFYLNDCIEQSQVFNTRAALILFDIDHFKAANDQLGHAKGDQIIQRVTQKINDCARNTDLLFRIGGDEFLLLATNTTKKEAELRTDSIRAAINAQPLLDDITISVSAGIASLDRTYTPAIWQQHADSALFAAKHAGRNRVETYSNQNKAK